MKRCIANLLKASLFGCLTGWQFASANAQGLSPVEVEALTPQHIESEAPLPTANRFGNGTSDASWQTPRAASQALSAATESVSLTLEEVSIEALERNPEIRVSAIRPEMARQDITVADAAFDPYLSGALIGGEEDRQLTDTLQGFGGNFDRQEIGTLLPLADINNLTLGRQLRAGGLAELGFGTFYERFFPVGPQRLINPAWQSAVNFHFEQPLLEGFGREIAQLPIAISQADQNLAYEEFRAKVNITLRDVELTYWELARLQANRRDYDALLESAAELVDSEREREALGESTLPDIIEAQDQALRIRLQRSQTLAELEQVSRRLSYQMGYPADTPTTIRAGDRHESVEQLQVPDLQEGLAALAFRPELQAQQAAIRSAQLELKQAIDKLSADLRLHFNYAVTGLDDDLDGSISTIADFENSTWSVGVEYFQNVRRRAERANVRKAKLLLIQERRKLAALDQDFAHQIQGLHGQLLQQRRAAQLADERFELAQRLYQMRLELRNEGKGDIGSVFRSQSALFNARIARDTAIYSYLKLLVQWRFQNGTIADRRFSIAESSPTGSMTEVTPTTPRR